MSRPAKSAEEKALTGASRRSQHVAAAGTPGKVPTFAPPNWLGRKDAREVWSRVVPELARFNIMTDVFRDVVARYCLHFADWIKLSREIAKTGTTVLVKMTNSDERMPRINPSIKVRDAIEKQLIDLEDRFGLSPLARYRIVAHQAAHPGQRDLFRDEPRVPEPGAPPDSAAPLPERASPIGALLN